MSLPTLKPITCPSCGANDFEHDSEGNLICSHCGVKYASPREEIVCPACQTLNPADAKVCKECGLALGRICPACDQVNTPGTEHCVNCGTPLDTLALVTSRMGAGKRRSDALRENRLVKQKGEDMVYMQGQRERIDAEERARLAQLAAQQQKSRSEQRTLTLVVGVILLLIVVGAAAASFLLASGR